MLKSIGGKWAVCYTEVVRFSEGPLLEVLLYTTEIVQGSLFSDQSQILSHSYVDNQEKAWYHYYVTDQKVVESVL